MSGEQDKRTAGLDPGKLSDLLRLARTPEHDEAPTSDDAAMARMLDDMLGEPLPLGSSAARMLPGLPPMLTSVLEFCDERSVGQLLFRSDTGLEQLRRIKDLYRERSRAVQSEQQRAAAVAVYYAAIAAAWLLHNVNVSSNSPQELAKAFDKLGQKAWIGDRLRGSYEQAAALCRKRVAAEGDRDVEAGT